MPSSSVVVAGVRYLLPQIERMTRSQRQQEFPGAASRRAVAAAFVDRKLGALKKGVTWERQTGCRVRKSAFGAVKKREMRLLAGGSAGTAAHRHSYMLRHKLAVHMVLTGKPIRCWAAVPDWGGAGTTACCPGRRFVSFCGATGQSS